MATQADESKIEAFPAKRFFVEMLTRDISLEDALLDLLDNCVDGIHRCLKEKPKNASKPYSGFHAEITFNGKLFKIKDNCGGMSAKLAREQAFMMGRPRSAEGISAPTVGMYGIGMKRSIFKMGQSARVISQTVSDRFQVKINKEWLHNDKNWHLKLEKIATPLTENGVVVEVKDLLPHIKNQFSDLNFEDSFKTAVARHYALIIEKGFKVTVNDIEIRPKKLSLIFQELKKEGDKVLAPYLYQENKDGIEIKLAVGFYAPMPSPTEVDDELNVRRRYHDAGWTIICNDRVVVYNDKTKLTGWGEANVPNFHNQFMGISGVVMFYTDDPWKLPLTTTKRGLEAGSELYLAVKNYMREGTKKFTTYTNEWKSFPEEERQISSKAQSKTITELLSVKASGPGWKNVRGTTALRFDPILPRPQKDTKKRIIHFARPIEEISMVSEYLFDDDSVDPSKVGIECFERVLEEARNAEE